MTVRPLDLEREYPRLCSWWKKRNLPPPPKAMLSGAEGFCVQASGIDVAVIWVLFSRKGTVAISEFLTSNPAMPNHAIARAVEALYDHIESYAKECGFPILFTSTQVDGSISRFLEKRGWLPCKGEPHCHMVKTV